VSEPANKRPEDDDDAAMGPKRDEKGRLLPGSTANPSGRPKKIKEFVDALHARFYDQAFIVMQELLASDDDKVRVAALKELWDRMFGKAPQAITGEDGGPIRFGADATTLEMLRKLARP
jgi:hypothetical protein